MVGSISSHVKANKACTSFADQTPLLSSKDGWTVATSVNTYEHEPGTHGTIEFDVAKPAAAQLFKSILVFVVAAAGAAAAITLFISLSFITLSFEMAIIIAYVAGSLCLMNSPIVMYKEWKILFSPSRRETVEQMQAMAEAMKSEAVFLKDEIEQLSSCASGFGYAEQDLKEIARVEGYCVDELVELVRVNEDTMDMMKENLRQKVIEDVIKIVTNSDKGFTERIDRVEAKLFALKIFVKLEAYGITFDQEKFSQVVTLNPTYFGVIGTIRKLLPPKKDHTDDASILSDRDDIYDMFYITSNENQHQRGSALASTVDGRSSLARRQTLIENRHALQGRRSPSSQR